MPDNRLPSSILSPTLSNDSIFALNIDTKQRFDNVFSGIQEPIKYPIPQYEPSFAGLPQRDLLDDKTAKGSLGEALFNPDRRISDYANSKLGQGLSNTLTSKGVGVPEQFPYDKSLDKYIKGDFGYDPYSSIEENEDFNYRYDYMAHTAVGRVLRNVPTGIGRFLTGVAAKTVQTFGYLGSMIWNGIEELIDPQGNNAMADIADNSLSRWAEKWEEDWKNSRALSVFKPANWDERGFFNKLGHGAFWTDEIADGAAFMGEMILSSYLAGGAGKLAGLGKFGATSINTASKLGGFGKGLDASLRLATGADDIAGIGRWAFLTASESAFEASETYKQNLDRIKRLRETGDPEYMNKSDRELEVEAGNKAAATFKGNMLALSLSNAFENRMIFNPIFRKIQGKSPTGVKPDNSFISVSGSTKNVDELAQASRKTYDYKTKIGRWTDWKNPNSRLRFYGKRSLQATGVEGFWEENAQLAVQRLASTDSLGFGSFSSQLVSQTKEALAGRDPEASTSIGLGALIGIGGVGGVAKVFGGDRILRGERRQREVNTQALINDYEKYRKEFLSFQDIFVRDEKGMVTDEDGRLQVDEQKGLSLMEGIRKFANKQDAISRIEDPLLRKNLQDDAMADYVFAAKRAGVFNTALDRFTNLQNVDSKQLIELGFDPAFTTDPVVMKDTMKEQGELYERAQKSRTRLQDSTEETELKDYNRKYALYKTLARKQSAENIAKEYQAAYLQDLAGVPLASAVDSSVQEYNSLLYQDEALRQFEQIAKEHNDFYKQHIKNERLRLERQRSEIEKSIQDRVDSGELIKLKNGVIYSRNRYRGLTPTEIGTYFDIDNTNMIKNAELTGTGAQMAYLADKLADPINGLQNYDDYLEFVDSIKQKDQEVDTTETKPGAVPEKTIAETQQEQRTGVVTPPVATDTTEDTDKEDITKKDVVVFDEKEIGTKEQDEIDPRKPLLFEYPNFSSKRDTENVDKGTEQLTSNQYDLMRADFIKTFMDADKNFKYKFKLFIIKDNFPEVYKGVKDKFGDDIVVLKDGKYQFTTPENQGEVIIIERPNGTRPLVSDFFQDKYKEIGNQPIIFSADKGLEEGMFMKEPLYSMRANTKAHKENITPEQAKTEYVQEMTYIKQAREYVRAHPEDKVQIDLVHTTSGIHPKTSIFDPVVTRFGNDFSFSIAARAEKGFKKGMIIAKIDNFSFPVTVFNVSNYPTVLSQVRGTLDYVFPTFKEAETIRDQFLNVMVYTNKERFFTIDKEGEGFKITFRVARKQDLDRNLPNNEIRKNAVINNDAVGTVRLNVSALALKEGYRTFDPATGKQEFLTKEDYEKFVKPKLVTNLKRIIDSSGKLYFDTVNPYFSFAVADPKIEGIIVPTPQEVMLDNFNRYKKRIEDLKNTNSLDYQVVKRGIEQKKVLFTQEQYDKLLEMIEPYNPENVQPKEDKKEAEVKPKTTESIADKYKNKPKEDVSKAIAGTTSVPTSYVVNVRNTDFVYIPDSNKIHRKSDGDEIDTSGSIYGLILEEFSKVYPHATTPAGTTGFAKVEVTDTEGVIYSIYAGPTLVDNPEFIAKRTGIGVVGTEKETAIEIVKAKLDDTNKAKLEEFQKRYC